MKRFKAIACVLAVAMIAGIFAGCSKTTTISTDKFAKACEKLKLDEMDFEKDEPDYDDIEDGFYAVADEDMVEDSANEMKYLLELFGLGDVIDSRDIKSLAFAAKCDGYEDLVCIGDPEELIDMKVDGAFALQVELDDNYVVDFMDFAEDILDQYDISTSNLSNKEFYSSKNDGYIRFHIDVAKFAKVILDNDDIMDLVDMAYDTDDFENICNKVKGDLAISFEINGSNIFIIGGGALNTKASTLGSFTSAFGAVNNPVKVPYNGKVVEQIVDDAIDNYGYLLGSVAGSGASYDDYGDYDFDDIDFDDWDT